MKYLKVIIVLSVSLLAAALNVYALTAQEERRSGGELVSVVAVGRRIEAGARIRSEDLAKREVPRAYLDERAVPSVEQTSVVGAEASVELQAGQVLLWSDIGRDRNRVANLAQRLPSGQRAMSIKVDKSSSIAGLLRPGHRVDILCTFTSGNRGTSATATVLQNVLVLATGERTETALDENSITFDTVTLSVGVDQAQKLALAAATGKLSVVLRGHDDLAVQTDLPEINVEDLRVVEPRRAGSVERPRSIDRVIERLVSR